MSVLQTSRKTSMVSIPSNNVLSLSPTGQFGTSSRLGQSSRGRTVILPLSNSGQNDNSISNPGISFVTTNFTDQPTAVTNSSDQSINSTEPTVLSGSSVYNTTTNQTVQLPQLEEILYSYGLSPASSIKVSKDYYLIKCYTDLCEAIYVISPMDLQPGSDKIVLKPGSVEMDMSIKRGLVDIIGNTAGRILLTDGIGCIIINNDYSNKEEHYLLESGNQTAAVLPEAFPVYSLEEITNPEMIKLANVICAKIRDYCSRLGQNICADLSRRTVNLNELIVSYMEGWNTTLESFRQEEGNLTTLLINRSTTDPMYARIRNSLCLVKSFITRMNQLTISSIHLNGWTIPQLYQLIDQYNQELAMNIEKFNFSLTKL